MLSALNKTPVCVWQADKYLYISQPLDERSNKTWTLFYWSRNNKDTYLNQNLVCNKILVCGALHPLRMKLSAWNKFSILV